MLIRIVLALIGLTTFLYIFWKRLREDYVESVVFTSGFYLIFGIAAGILASFYFNRDLWFWLGFLGEVIAIIIVILRYKLRVFELVEASVLASLPFLFLFFTYDFIKAKDIYSGAAAAIIVFLIGIFTYLDAHYKDFTWYKSGKIGFSGLIVLGLFFIIRAAVALFLPDVISFLKSYDAIFSAIISFISFLAVYNLAQVKS